jgi:hypothetical protein
MCANFGFPAPSLFLAHLAKLEEPMLRLALRQLSRIPPVFRSAAAAGAIALVLAACAEGPAARSTGAQRQAAIDSLKDDVPPESTEMARGQCWMKYENTKAAHNLDEKMKLVDQCMEEKKKRYPLVVQ